MQMNGFAYNFVFGFKGFGDHFQRFEAVVMIVRNEFFRGFYTITHLPTAIYHIEAIDKDLHVVAR